MDNEEKFKTWLGKMGAEVLSTTNEWEVVRFKAEGDTSIIYKQKSGRLTFTGAAQSAYDAWKHGNTWKAVNRRRKHLTQLKSRIAARDGKGCFFCGLQVKTEFLTIEHILSFRHGGTDNINNLALACQPCQNGLGSDAVTDKIKFRDQQRAKLVATKQEDLPF